MKNPAKLLRNNRMLQYGLLTAPCAVLAVSLKNALILCLVTAVVWGLTAVCTAPIPAKLPTALRVVLYSVTAGLVYIPAGILAAHFSPLLAGNICLPLCCAMLCFSAEDMLLFPQNHKLRTLFCDISGCCVILLLTGFLRELLGSGSLMAHTLTEHPPLPFLLTAPGGVILPVIFGAAVQAISADHPEKEVPHDTLL